MMEFGADPLRLPDVLTQSSDASRQSCWCVTLTAGPAVGLGSTPEIKADPATGPHLLWAGGRHKTWFLCSLRQRKTLSMMK